MWILKAHLQAEFQNTEQQNKEMFYCYFWFEVGHMQCVITEHVCRRSASPTGYPYQQNAEGGQSIFCRMRWMGESMMKDLIQSCVLSRHNYVESVMH